MVAIHDPKPLQSGDRIEIPAPSMGVPKELHERLYSATNALKRDGFDPHLRPHATVGGLMPATAQERAEDLAAAFAGAAGAVLPPWGGELAIELVEHLDWDAIAEEGTWFVGWSDISTLLMPLTILTGVATLHGANLMDEPWELPTEFQRWTEVAGVTEGDSFIQHSAPHRRSRPWVDWNDEPLDRDSAYETPTQWRSLDGGPVRMRGRLIGGCLETVSLLAGSRFGDVPGFAQRHAPEGMIVYLESAGSDAPSVLRMLWSLRLAGWFRHASGILIGRSSAAETSGLNQAQALDRALGDLEIPVIFDFDIGHQPPQMPLINGALADIKLSDGHGIIVQHLAS
ncbi:LD-carboxypeptidase [Arthrobacter sp. BL-252-APC-1A]|uniref:S66 family peptidase n=1 Tax=Arthrobacter sp. BL-252-APC-1A TaxID=2606622 RepID=UPI0012B2C6BA|nr:S66 peptidase family protein [Arthrobacter sp. BL-252-APC-1A]MSR99611.1 LD-carboxypeptidase [Arthrobacter sp. BL-252-APC-1A]